MATKPTIAIDFDGVIHSYERGWQEGNIYGTVVPGFFEWAAEAKNHLTLVVYSSRSDSHKNVKPMIDWMTVHLQKWRWDREDTGEKLLDLSIKDFEFPIKKPPAFVTIDDRAIVFKGQWEAEELKPENILKYKSWTQEQGK